MSPSYLMALDVGERRIGVAIASTIAKVASPFDAIINDDKVFDTIESLIDQNNIGAIIVGLPRNMQGEETKQSEYVRGFITRLKQNTSLPVVLQDESLTSVHAEEHLKESKKKYSKGQIDSESAVIILNDYIREKL